MNAMYCAEQINIPEELGTIMKQYTKAVLRDKPRDLYKYSANFFAILAGEPVPFNEDGQCIEENAAAVKEKHAAYNASNNTSSELNGTNEDDEMANVNKAIEEIFRRYDFNGQGFTTCEDVEELLNDLSQLLQLDENALPSAEEICGALSTNDDLIDLIELRQYLFQGIEEQK